MKIEDTKALYEFIGQLDWLAWLALLILIALVIAYVVIGVADKLYNDDNKKLKRIFTSVVCGVTIGCGIILKIKADSSYTDLIAANSIKSWLQANNQKYKNLMVLAGLITLDPDDTGFDKKATAERADNIKRIIKMYPNEFINCKVDEGDGNGVELIDDNAAKSVDSSVMKMLPFYQSKIVYYMLLKAKPIIDYRTVKDSIDGRCYDSELIDLILAKSKKILIPYARNNTAYIVLNTALAKEWLYTK